MNIPILIHHNPQEVIGRMYVESNQLTVIFKEEAEVTVEDAMDIFRGAGVRIMKRNGDFITKLIIHEFSFIPGRALGVRGDC